MFDLDVLFCHVDDFCKAFETQWHKKLLNHGEIKLIRAKSLCLSEIMTVLIAFHSYSLPEFQAFLFELCKTAMVLCFSWSSELSEYLLNGYHQQ